jgi:hypothetical protein
MPRGIVNLRAEQKPSNRFMKRMNLWKSVAVLLCAGTITSCIKTGPIGLTGPQGAAGLAYIGAIAGYVSLFDQYGNPTDVGLNGINISLDSLNNPISGAGTAANGYYILPNVYTGSYLISAQSSSTTPAYGYNQVSLQYLSDTLIKNISMSAQADFAPTALAVATSTTLGVDSLYITIAPDTQVRNVIVFAGSSSTVSSTNYVYAFPVNINANTTAATAVVPAVTLYNLGLASGSTVYFAVYGEPVEDKSIYFNQYTGQNVYTALSAASVSGSGLVP